MGVLSTEMLFPRANEENFGFAFNDSDFSDRILRLEITPDDEPIDSSKNLRGEKYHGWFSSINADHNEVSESCHTKKRKKTDLESYDGAKVVTLHIISVILAAKSPFFYKLFKNGMRESQHKNEVSLIINASEEATMMNLLHFMYGSTLSATSVTDLVDLLIAADKFEVASCMRYSVQMLLKLPMSLEYAILYLELPSSVLMSEIVQPLIDEAKKYVFARYKNFTKSQEEAMELPLSALEVVLGSKGLQVDSEDHLFDFTLKWACAHYPDLEERRDILTKRFTRLICFPNMSSSKLKEVLVCPNFDHEQVSKLVLEALFSKVEISCGQQLKAKKDLATTTDFAFSGRVYKPRCVVYFDLKKGELRSSSSSFESQSFFLGVRQFHLSAQWNQLAEKRLCLYVCMERTGYYGTCTIDFEFAVMKSSKKFISMSKASDIALSDYSRQASNPLEISWTDLMSNDDYYVNDILHFRAEITLRSS